MENTMLKAALIGFGGISRSHRKGYANLEKLGKVKLVCACDVNPEAFTKSVSTNLDSSEEEPEESIRTYTDLSEMLEKESFDFADVCVPTFLHREITEKLLRSGHHVLCEKPMSLTYSDCTEMLKCAEECERELMIGQCVRFYAAFDYLKKALSDGRFGKPLGALFTRISTTPTWGWENWFMDPERSGGCITDLHIHDIDVIRYLFGEPDAVSSRTTSSISLHDTVHTSLFYGSFPVTAVGDWSQLGVSFEAKCSVSLEAATAVFDGKSLLIYPKDGTESYVAASESVSGYQAEIDYFCDVITGKIKNTKNTARSAAETVRLIEHLRKSAECGGKIIEFREN